MNKKVEGDLMRFSDLDLNMFSRTEKSEKRRSEGGTALPERVEATLVVIFHMAKLATEEHTKMGREALERVETQWRKPVESVEEGVNQFFVTNRRVVESDSSQDEFVARFNVDLAASGEAVRTQALRLKRGGTRGRRRKRPDHGSGIQDNAGVAKRCAPIYEREGGAGEHRTPKQLESGPQ